MKESKEISFIQNQKSIFNINVDPKDMPLIERQFFGKTQRDLEIEAMPIPKNPYWLMIVISMIRLYQRNLSSKLGNRCVFDPSCSHYSELAFRENGFIKGVKSSISRLFRCRSSNGGLDDLK